MARQAYAYFLRSPYAHAKIAKIDTSAARAAPGVLGVFTEADVAAEKLGTTRLALPRKRADGSPAFSRPHPGLARGFVRYVGDPVAMVVAESLAEAKDAAELIAIDYDERPAVVDIEDAVKPGAPRVWEENPDNVSHIFETGNKAAADAAFATAAHVVKRKYVITRVHAQYMEPRGTVGAYDASDERFTLHADVQYAHRVRDMLAGNVFKIPETQIRIVTGDVGGGFGTKGWQYVEHRLTLMAARRLGRPVKWSCERSEVLLADEHGRDVVAEAELALDKDLKFLGLRARLISNIGAYLSSDRNLLATFGSLGALVGVYDIPAGYAHLTVAFSNQPATAPYRGAGRPEAIYIIERLIEDAARELQTDRVALRRKNLIPPSRLPFKTPLGGLNYDCGDFPGIMEKALKLGDAAGFDKRRDELQKRGKLRGLGIANAIERAAGPGPEFAELRFNTGGGATLLMGTIHQGQGHETSFRQIAIEKLGLEPSDIRYVDGDTDVVAFGTGTNGSRSTVIGGTAITVAADKIIAKTKKLAAHLLEAAEADVQFADGRFTIAGTDRGLTLKEVATRCVSAGEIAERHGAGALRDRHVLAAAGHVPERQPSLRGRDRSRYRQGRADELHRGRRCRHGDQSEALERPDSGRHRARRGPGADGARGLRSAIRPTALGLVHGLRHAARRRFRPDRDRKRAGADQAQPAGRERRGRGGDGGRVAGGDAGSAGCAAAARRHRARHAGNARAGVAGDTGGAEIGLRYRV